MLFNSYEFLLAFLPACLFLYYVLALKSRRVAAIFLAIASLVFYTWWEPQNLPILLGSILFNYTISFPLLRQDLTKRQRQALLGFAIACNLGVLFYYKYAAFASAALMGMPIPTVSTIPLGISFFTFTQIAFLVDASRRDVNNHSFINYLLFVTFFPHLIAGPILHHNQMMPQFSHAENYRLNWEKISPGLAIFIIGLAKKVLLADSLIDYIGPTFARAEASFIEVWCAALAYTLQIYFDFSGYSDMAIGLGLMFGIRLPLNFNSPYQSLSIIEFWRRWHITLSAFLRDYLYIPLGGNRHGASRRWLNIMITMLLGGLWHGANWTFIVWGALHGFYLVVNHMWRKFQAPRRNPSKIAIILSWAITFIAVVIAWVFFRAPDVETATQMLLTMSGYNGIVFPETYQSLPGFSHLARLGFRFEHLLDFFGLSEIAVLLFIGAIAVFLPNSQTIVLGENSSYPLISWLQRALPIRPSIPFAIILGLLLTASLIGLSSKSEFLYFQF